MISASMAGPGVADGLDVELPELAIAAGLRAVVAEHRPDLAQLHRLRPGLHPVLDVRPDDPGGRFRTERQRLGLLGPRGEPEQLLLDDVGDLADAALEDGRLTRTSASRSAGSRSGRPGPRPAARGGVQTRRLGWQQVAGAARRSKGGIAPNARASRGGRGPDGARSTHRSRADADRGVPSGPRDRQSRFEARYRTARARRSPCATREDVALSAGRSSAASAPSSARRA